MVEQYGALHHVIDEAVTPPATFRCSEHVGDIHLIQVE